MEAGYVVKHMRRCILSVNFTSLTRRIIAYMVISIIDLNINKKIKMCHKIFEKAPTSQNMYCVLVFTVH